ncbi:MAG: hypothetical protein J6C84_05135 [Lachnospiraceae bacterium]|nr:hypothetical protein [Lachnospiraceae bacterium]
MEEKKEKYNSVITERLIYIMGGIGLLFAAGGLLAGNLIGIVILGILPVFLLVMFMLFKHPVYGILYTILFVYARSNLLFTLNVYWPVTVVIIGLLLFFVHVDYRSYVRWKELKKIS